MTSAYFGSPRGLVSYCNTYPCFDTVEVWGSSPHGPTIQNKDLAQISKKHSGVQKDTLLRPFCVLLPETSRLSTELGHVLCRVGNG